MGLILALHLTGSLRLAFQIGGAGPATDWPLHRPPRLEDAQIVVGPPDDLNPGGQAGVVSPLGTAITGHWLTMLKG